MPSIDTQREIVHAFSRLAATAEDGRAFVDDQTWADLDMDAVCERIDRTASVPGRLVFGRLLRTPTTDRAALEARHTSIESLSPGRAGVGPLRSALERLGRVAGAEDLMRLLWEEPPSPLPHAWLHRALAVLAVLSIPLALTFGGAAVFAPIVVFAINAGVHFRTRVQWQWEIQALRFVGALRACARQIDVIAGDGLHEHRQRLTRALHESDLVARRIGWLSATGLKDLLYEYLNVFFLLELRAYQAVIRRWPEALPALRELFVAIGELDALGAVGRWREGLPLWCAPELDAGSPHVEIEDGVHPLIEAPVPNSLGLAERGCLVTGANMSGKSTLLRVIGVNALLAQAICTCTARRYRATPLRVVSSMRVGDALTEGKSRYLAEAERLLTLVRLTESAEPTLCLVDELLSGTNTAERLAASQAILSHLARHGMLVLAATHDLELSEHLAPHYDSYFFADDFSRDDLRFDHRLQRGVATTRNAIRLLERLGYPEEILAEARNARSGD